jgi:hypothetical protein
MRTETARLRSLIDRARRGSVFRRLRRKPSVAPAEIAEIN